MRRAFLIKIIGIFIVLLNPINLYAQTNNSIIGYDRVQWGSSIQTVQQVYQNLKEVESKDSDIGIKEFVQTNINSNNMISRIFYFFQNKLFCVTINYNTNDYENTVRAILSSIVTNYGRYNIQNSSGGGVDAYFVNEDYVRWNYNNNLKIELRIGELSGYKHFLGNFIICIFTNPITENDIEVAKVRARQDNNRREYVVPRN
jgi:hypothetical protein